MQHAFQVIAQHCQAHFTLGATPAAQQETRMAEDPVLEAGEGMFRATSSQTHGLGGRSLLHPCQRLFMNMTVDRAAPRPSAARFQPTGTAGLGRGLVNDAMAVLR